MPVEKPPVDTLWTNLRSGCTARVHTRAGEVPGILAVRLRWPVEGQTSILGWPQTGWARRGRIRSPGQG